MDTDTIRSLLAFFGGALAFVGAVLTFVHGRLKDAETPKQRDSVVTWTLEIGSVALNILGFALILFTENYLLSIVPFSVALIIRAILFLRQRGPVRRGHVLTIALVGCSFTLFVAMAVTFHFLSRILNILDKMVR